MKSMLLFLSLFPLLFLGCNDDKDKGVAPVCEITSPTDGAIHNLFDDLVIKGTASDEDGTVAKVLLTVDGDVVSSVVSVPFEHTVKAADLTEKVMDISLYVEDNDGLNARKDITVTVVDKSQAPICSITSPEHGQELNVFKPFVVKGEGEAVSGEISKVTLTIGDDIISEVASLPFEYNVEAEKYDIGSLIITLEVENTTGRSAKDMVTVMLTDQNIAPTCSITEPEDGNSFEPEDVIVIKGTGKDEDGTIVKAVLKIKGNIIPGITTVPFEYTLDEEYKEAGNVTVSLEVTDNNAKTAIDEITFTILGMHREFTDPRDQKVYKTVKIGTQEWFAENLAYLPEVYPGDTGSENDEGKAFYYVYDYNGSDVNEAKATQQYREAGVMYNFWAAMDGAEPTSDYLEVPSGVKGICPDGWHLPSQGEWWILSQWCYSQIPDEEGVMYYDASGTPYNDNSTRLIKNIMGRLKARNAGWSISNIWVEEFPESGNAPTDEWGFAGFPSGVRFRTSINDTHFFYYAGGSSTSLYFWTPSWDDYTYPNTEGGLSVSFGYKYDLSFGRGGTDTSRAFSIRCVKD